jgi:hypothetical protein
MHTASGLVGYRLAEAAVMERHVGGAPGDRDMHVQPSKTRWRAWWCASASFSLLGAERLMRHAYQGT